MDIRDAPPGTEIRPGLCPLDCPDTCSLEITVRDGRAVAVDGSKANPLTDGFICGKVRRLPDHVYGPERLRYPALRVGAKGAGDFRRAAWDEALDLVADRLRTARDAHGGEAILPFAYGGSNGFLTDGAVDARLFARLGASRLARTVCAAPSTRAATGLYGKMPGVALEDYVHARLIVVWGANPEASGIHVVPRIREAQRRGARLVVVDPRRTKLARQADLHLAPRPGADLPLALAVIRWLFEADRADSAFLARHATGVEALRQRCAPWTIGRAAEAAGVPAADVERLARLYADGDPAVIRCGWGLERNRNGGSAVAAVLALPAVAGKFGVRGGGYTMSNSGAWAALGAAAAHADGSATREINMNRLGRVLTAPVGDPIRCLFVYNANPLATLPDQNRVRAGLERDDLFTVVFDAVMTDTARYADVVLPATTFIEHDELRSGYGTYGLLRSRPAVAPVGEARPNPAVFADLCRRLGLYRPGDPETPDELVAALLDATGRGESLRAVLDAEGIAYPPTGARPVQFVDVLPFTPDRLVHLVPETLDHEAPDGLYTFRPDPGSSRFPLALISPSTERTISSTFGQLVEGPVPLRMCPVDAAARGVADGDVVRVFNDLGAVTLPARLDPGIRPGVVVLPKGLWMRHTLGGGTSNALVPDDYTDLGDGACFNDARVEVERVGPGPD